MEPKFCNKHKFPVRFTLLHFYMIQIYICDKCDQPVSQLSRLLAIYSNSVTRIKKINPTQY